ncbi:hypothetical protein ABKV19_011880 [Rosa sericea]
MQIVPHPISFLKMTTELDRISNLPGGVIQKILSYLPIREAVRTCVLSSNWRCKWAMLPRLVFDDHQIGTTSKARRRKTTFVSIVDRVLLLQIGPVDAFELVYRKFIAASDVDRWILHLTRKSLKEFTLTKSRGSQYNISSCLFSCQELIHLDLNNCSLCPPSRFKGFRRLKSLRLQNITVVPDVFEKLIGSCPLLERLTLIDLHGITHLKIDAPNLQFLEVQDTFEDVKVENTLNLVDVSIDFGEASSYCSNLLKYFVQLPLMERLTIKGFLSKCAIGSSAEELPKPCRCLKFLSLGIRLNNLEEILAAICFLRSSPALQELKISVHQEGEATAGEATYWLNENHNWAFTQLRLMKVTAFSGVKAEVDFIKFLLLSSPALEELEIVAPFEDQAVSGEVNSWLDDNLNWAFTQLRLVKVTCFSGVKAEVDFIKFLLLSSPALQELQISARHHVVLGEVNSWSDDNQNCVFTHLRVVQLTGIHGVKPEVDFIRFLLSSSPVLERMTIQPTSVDCSLELLKKLVQFRRVSVDAEISYLDPLSSESDEDSDFDDDYTDLESDSDSD